MTFSEQLKERGAFCRAIVSASVMAGYGVGTVRAHVDPALKAVARKLNELTPECVHLTIVGFREGISLGKSDEMARRAERLARKGDIAGAARAAWGAVTS
jgi:hypothetical protein